MLNKDYHTNGASLEVKTQTPSNVSFKVQGTRDSKSDHISGDLEGKWTDKVHGLTLTQSWTTLNVLRNQFEVENLIAKGLKLDLATSLSPEKGAKTAVLSTVYKQSGFHTRAALDVLKVRFPNFDIQILIEIYRDRRLLLMQYLVAMVSYWVLRPPTTSAAATLPVMLPPSVTMLPNTPSPYMV